MLVLLSILAACSTPNEAHTPDAGWRKLEYVGGIETLPANVRPFLDCRRSSVLKDKSNSFVVLKDKLRRAPHFTVLQYWVVATDSLGVLKAGDFVFANFLDCKTAVIAS